MSRESRILFGRILTAGALVLAAVTSWAVTGSISQAPDLVIKAPAETTRG